MEKDVRLAKIVATPTSTSWSQAYNAGKLFAVLSLEKSPPQDLAEPATDEQDLGVLGKEVLEALEQEFFTLETKDLESIKKAVEASSSKIPENIMISFVVATLAENVLYVLIKGQGKADLKRGEKLGTVLESKENSFTSASGFVESNDVVVLQTQGFTELVSQDTLSSSINAAPSEIAEILAPMIHEKEKGGAASLILEFKDGLEEAPVVTQVAEETGENASLVSRVPSLKILNSYFFEAKNLIKQRHLPSLPHSKRVLLTIGVILFLVFVGSVYFAVKSQNDSKVKALYEKTYVSAERKFEEGESLLGLNQVLARDSFLSAKQILEDGKSGFKKGSNEAKKVDELLAKIEKVLSETSGIIAVSAIEVDSGESEFLSVRNQPGVLYVAKEEDKLYSLSADEVKDGSENEVIIENDKDWSQAGGFGTYLGNIYVLDKSSDQILKFVATTGSEYGKADYFKTKPELGSATGIAIDGSIWVLHKTGDLIKFTRGEKDSFQISGLDKAFSSPTRIFTNVDFNNVYILDNGNSRIVVIDKEGKYVSQYQASVLKGAKDLEVLEKDKKIFILVGSKIFQIDIK